MSDEKITPADRRAVAAGVVNRIGGLARDVRQFPANIEEAKLQEALQGLEVALNSPNAANLTREQFAAAVLIGRGMTFHEAAKGLQVDEGHLHLWSRTIVAFRREIALWREALEIDVEARLYGRLATMMANIHDLGDGDQIRLLTLAQKVASRPETREQWKVETAMKQEQLQIQREQIKQAATEATRDARVVDVIEYAAEEIYDQVAAIEGAGDDDDL